LNESDKPISCQPLVTVPSVDIVQAPSAAQAPRDESFYRLALTTAKATMQILDKSDRLEVMRRFCPVCGDIDCYCKTE